MTLERITPFSLFGKSEAEVTQAREGAVEELRNFLSNAEIGSPAFVAFCDYTDHLAATIDRDHSLASINIYKETQDYRHQQGVDNLNPHQIDVLEQNLRIAETHYALIQRDLERNSASIPGYFQAQKTMSRLGSLVMFTNPSTKGDDHLTQTHALFAAMREEVYSRLEPPPIQ